MGAEQSKPEGLVGFQIASVAPQSPAHEGGLIPYFDIIVATDGVQLDTENSADFRDYVLKHKDKSINLKVYNTKTKTLRDVVITPTDTWGGVGLLGCSINWESVDNAQEYIWHITGVRPGTPAEEAGIQSGRDYLIGMQSADISTPSYITMFSDKTDFHARMATLSAFREYPNSRTSPRVHQLLLLLYDNVDNSVRETMVDLGTSPSLGCDVANGYLHCISHTPGDTRLPIIRQFYIDPTPQEQPEAAAAAAAAGGSNVVLPPPPAPVGTWSNPALKNVPYMPQAAATVPTTAPVLPPPPGAALDPPVPPAPVSAEGANAPPAPTAVPRTDSDVSTPQTGASPVALGQQSHGYTDPAWASALNSTLS